MPYASNYIEAREATEFNCFFVDEFNSMLRVVPTPLCGHSSVRAVKNELAAGLRYTSAFREKASQRSEEHTSELQSLMRTSYAVFCLKKKNIIIRQSTYTAIYTI